MCSKEKQDKCVKLVAKCTDGRMLWYGMYSVARIPARSLQLFLKLKLLSTLMLFLSVFLAAGRASVDFERWGMREIPNCLVKGSERTG